MYILIQRYKKIRLLRPKEFDFVCKLVKTKRAKKLLFVSLLFSNLFDRIYIYASSETDSLALFLARRALITLRPLAEDIRKRKPCLFFLFLLEG